MNSTRSRRPNVCLSSEHPAPAWSCLGSLKWVSGTGFSPDLGIQWPRLLVRSESPLLQAVALSPKGRAAMFCKIFITLNTCAEMYLASAEQLCRGFTVTLLQPECHSRAFTRQPERRGRGKARRNPTWGGKGCPNISGQQWRNSIGGPQTLSDGQVGPHYWSWL